MFITTLAANTAEDGTPAAAAASDALVHRVFAVPPSGGQGSRPVKFATAQAAANYAGATELNQFLKNKLQHELRSARTSVPPSHPHPPPAGGAVQFDLGFMPITPGAGTDTRAAVSVLGQETAHATYLTWRDIPTLPGTVKFVRVANSHCGPESVEMADGIFEFLFPPSSAEASAFLTVSGWGGSCPWVSGAGLMDSSGGGELVCTLTAHCTGAPPQLLMFKNATSSRQQPSSQSLPHSVSSLPPSSIYTLTAAANDCLTLSPERSVTHRPPLHCCSH